MRVVSRPSILGHTLYTVAIQALLLYAVSMHFMRHSTLPEHHTMRTVVRYIKQLTTSHYILKKYIK